MGSEENLLDVNILSIPAIEKSNLSKFKYFS